MGKMKKNSEYIDSVYEISIPYFDSSTVKNFNFNSKVGEDSLSIFFRYSSKLEKWRGWIKINENNIRLISTNANVISWSRFKDYSVTLSLEGDNLSLSDLEKCKIIFIKWK